MRLSRLVLDEFRNFSHEELSPAREGVTLLRGANGQGKTNILEAISVVATLESFRGADSSAMIRQFQPSARIGAELLGERDHLVDIEVVLTSARTRAFRNGNLLKRNGDIVGEIRAVAFFPDDLDLIKAGPAVRRRFLDDGLIAISPRFGPIRSAFERAARQRARLLKQVGGHLTNDLELALDVWDDRVADTGSRLVAHRENLCGLLIEPVNDIYQRLSGESGTVSISYTRSWEGELLDALVQSRREDVRAGIPQLGPQRDDLAICLANRPARSCSSQGEQRCLALALRLGIHRVASEGGLDTVGLGPRSDFAPNGDPPILLLDDVFSELDPIRSAALAESLPAGQVFISAAGEIPSSLKPAVALTVSSGRIDR